MQNFRARHPLPSALVPTPVNDGKHLQHLLDQLSESIIAETPTPLDLPLSINVVIPSGQN